MSTKFPWVSSEILHVNFADLSVLNFFFSLVSIGETFVAYYILRCKNKFCDLLMRKEHFSNSLWDYTLIIAWSYALCLYSLQSISCKYTEDEVFEIYFANYILAFVNMTEHTENALNNLYSKEFISMTLCHSTASIINDNICLHLLLNTETLIVSLYYPYFLLRLLACYTFST